MIEAEGAIGYVDNTTFISTGKTTEEAAAKLERLYGEVAIP